MENNGFIKINDVQIGNIERFELKRYQTPPQMYNPSMDIEMTEERRNIEIAISNLSREWTGKICLVFNKDNAHQASMLNSNSKFKFELQIGCGEIATGTAYIEAINFSHDLVRNITFKVIGKLIITRKIGE